MTLPKAPTEFPRWMAYLNPNSRLNARDLQEIFGYKSIQCVYNAMDTGALPKPDDTLVHKNAHYRVERPHWKASTIILEIRRRKLLRGLI